MQSRTLDLTDDELLLIKMFVVEFIDESNRALRECGKPEDSEELRRMLEVASTLRGKLPIYRSLPEQQS